MSGVTLANDLLSVASVFVGSDTLDIDILFNRDSLRLLPSPEDLKSNGKVQAKVSDSILDTLMMDVFIVSYFTVLFSNYWILFNGLFSNLLAVTFTSYDWTTLNISALTTIYNYGKTAVNIE